MRLSARSPLGLGLVTLLMAGSCVAGDSATGVGNGALPAGVHVQPAVVPSAADASALPVNRIRAVTTGLPGSEVLDDTTVVVDPNASVWDASIRVRLIQSPRSARVLVQLVNEDGAGVRTTQYSGITDTLSIASGEISDAGDIPLVRGPPANLYVTGVEITSGSTLAVGETLPLEATVTTAGPGDPTLYWTSLDTAVVTVSGAAASGVVPGSALVVATAGAVSDTTQLRVIVPAVAAVEVVPDSADVAVGQTLTLAATLLDADGAVLTGRQITWTSNDVSVALVDAEGTVSAVGAGTTTIQAASEGVTGAAIVNVVVPVASVVVTPDSANVPVGGTMEYAAEVLGPNATVLTGRVVTWTTADPGVAAVDGSGVVSGVGVGRTTVTATSEGVSGNAVVVVEAAPPAAPHTLVFSSQRAGASLDIWTGSDDGTSVSRLTSSPLDELGARWSPDGSQIVFTGSDGATQLIWLMDEDGANLSQLSPDQSNHREPDWSPGGDYIIFTVDDGSQEDIWYMLKDGTGPTEITVTGGVNEFDPTISPDGTRFLYVTDEQLNNDIWVADFPTGSNSTEVTFSSADESDPDWSPDGSRIAFVRTVDVNDDVWIMNADGSGQIQLTTDVGRDWLPVFSPDGTRIYWMSDRSGNFEIWVMDVDGSNKTQLTNEPGVDGAADVRK